MLISGATVEKKRGYSSSPSSSTRKSGISLLISQTVFQAQIFSKFMLMGHFGPFLDSSPSPNLMYHGLLKGTRSRIRVLNGRTGLHSLRPIRAFMPNWSVHKSKAPKRQIQGNNKYTITYILRE